MTLPYPDPPRKHRRGFLYTIWVLFVLAAIVWSLGWLWLRGEAGRRMDTAAADLRGAGYEVAWDQRHIGGYPFRLNVNLTNARIAEPSGWALQAPALNAQAFAYSPGKWVAVAPQGVTMIRPIGGPLNIRGRVLRASASEFGAHPPRIAIEAREVTFEPGASARPFLLQEAKELHLHLRAGPDDQGAVLLRVNEARAELPGLLARIADNRPVTLNWEMILSHMSAFDGDDWPTVARAWSNAGGSALVRRASLRAGDAELTGEAERLTVGADGRVQGTMQVDLRQAPSAIYDMSGGTVAADPGVAQATLNFQNGQTTLGPLPIAPAPRVY